MNSPYEDFLAIKERLDRRARLIYANELALIESACSRDEVVEPEVVYDNEFPYLRCKVCSRFISGTFYNFCPHCGQRWRDRTK